MNLFNIKMKNYKKKLRKNKKKMGFLNNNLLFILLKEYFEEINDLKT